MDFDGFHRVVNLPDNDSRPGVFVGRKGPGGQQFEGGQIASHILEPDPPDRDEKQPADYDCDGGGGVVPANDPAVEVGGVIEHQVEHRIVAGHGEGPVEETPCRAAQPGKDQDRIAPFHGACLRRVSARLWSVFGAFPQGSIGRERPPKGGVTGKQTRKQTPSLRAAPAAKKGGSLPSCPSPPVRHGLAGLSLPSNCMAAR